MTEYIICSSIYVDDNKTYVHQPKNIYRGYVVCGRRHHNCIQTLVMIDKNWKQNFYKQGFLTSQDEFVDRKKASMIALLSGQIKNIKEELFSEDLY